MPNLGPTELIIILIIVLLLFGGSRLAGLGKSTGRALKEFKEETRGLGKKGEEQTPPPPYQAPSQISPSATDYSGSDARTMNYPPNGEHPVTPPTTNPTASETRRDA